MDRIIVPTGYMGSGSSAITDLISEFKDCSNEFKSYEYVFLHCPNGLFDLEDHLLIGNNALKSDISIRLFKEQMKKLYDKPFWWVGNYKKIIGENFLIETNNYIDNLIQYRLNSYWYPHEEVNNKMFWKLLIRKPIKILTRNKLCNKKVLKYNDGMLISYITPKEFYELSHKYIYNVLEMISKGKSNIILDQLILPFNLHRIDNYFDDKLKVIVVERDPRDVFILNKYIWGEKQIGVPFPNDVKEFCRYYRSMRNSEINSNSNKILRIKFEDLIYKYDASLNKIMEFLNFNNEEHINKKSRFNPDISIKNTQLFRNSKYQEEVAIIEKELQDYLYDFPYEINNDVKSTVEFE